MRVETVIHKEIEQFPIDNLKELSLSKDIYVWGAGNQGRGVAQVLSNFGVNVTGYIDGSKDLHGKIINSTEVFSPKVLEKNIGNIFIIISVFYYSEEIRVLCENYGLKEGVSFIHYSRLKPRDYSIDISGSCNLKCISCPRATHSNKERDGGFMSLETFKKVINKLKKEDPFVGNIQLYQWGEPTLNKELPEMIAYAKRKGISSAISSNLNLDVDYKRIIRAEPEWFRISSSSWGKDYEISHTGGDWSKFLHNIKVVSKLRKEFYPSMKIELYYHIYKHSIGEPLKKMRQLAKDLDIEFHPVYAYLISLDDETG
jgi:pyruvate-formate lyase-activating enzyme